MVGGSRASGEGRVPTLKDLPPILVTGFFHVLSRYSSKPTVERCARRLLAAIQRGNRGYI
jgi:hypothetical protein